MLDQVIAMVVQRISIVGREQRGLKSQKYTPVMQRLVSFLGLAFLSAMEIQQL